MMNLSEDTLWEATLNRDSRYDGLCYYGVTSTDIYCRLHCTSKKPLRENTRFFFSREGAEKTGFRPCKRCRPDKAKEPKIDHLLSKVVATCRYVESCDYIPTLKELAQQVGTSPFHLQRVFKQALGISPRNYADAHRQFRFKKAIQSGDDIAFATYDAGYGSSSRVYEQSQRYLGMTPKAYKQKGIGQTIFYSIARCPLGQLLLATTTKGVCAVRLGNSRKLLVDELKDEFVNAVVRMADSERSKWQQAIINYLSGNTPWPKLPYDVQATAFQRKVWDFLRTIPEGKTAHYSDIAAAIGQPTASRAVARACATNPVALVIPCHRVVPKAGGVGGYRWGPERKKKLLVLEQQKKQN